MDPKQINEAMFFCVGKIYVTKTVTIDFFNLLNTPPASIMNNDDGFGGFDEATAMESSLCSR